jgi:hypothetical protein
LGAATCYSLYGLTIDSPVHLEAAPCSLQTRPDVRLREGTASRFENLRRRYHVAPFARDWFEATRLGNGSTYLRWASLFEFVISSSGRTIEFRRLKYATDVSFTTYLLGQALSFSLLARGCDALHASAVVVDGGAIAFLGDCGYGKSTLSAAFVARGFPILTDDVLALERRGGRWMAHSGPARVKLFPTIARKLLPSATGRLMNPGTSKLVIRLDHAAALESSVPLRALYVLTPPDSVRRRNARIVITPLSEPNAFLQILRATFNLISVSRTRLSNQFGVGTRMAREIPVRRLSYTRALSGIDRVCDAVLKDVASLQPVRTTRAGFVRQGKQ